ncbi:FlgD immunoglobulin-like domain containing protein [Candidatus Omnitrophota bacterium]
MNSKLSFLCGSVTLIFTMIANVNANESPILSLQEGVNDITLSVCNNFNFDIDGLKLTIDREKLPHWVSVKHYDSSLDVERGNSKAGKITLQLVIMNAPELESATIPLIIQDDDGNIWKSAFTVSVTSVDELKNSCAYSLLENYPNPFNPETSITYTLAKEGRTKLEVFNFIGQKIRTLVDTSQTPGMHRIIWDGKNDSGQQVSSGLYIYRLISGSFVESKQMIMLK